MIWYRQWFDLMENPWKSARNTIVFNHLFTPHAGVSCIFSESGWVLIQSSSTVFSVHCQRCIIWHGDCKNRMFETQETANCGLSGWLPLGKAILFDKQLTPLFAVSLSDHVSLHCNQWSKIDTKTSVFSLGIVWLITIMSCHKIETPQVPRSPNLMVHLSNSPRLGNPQVLSKQNFQRACQHSS
jgi:hypothetical protein